MKKCIEWLANGVAEVICMVTRANVACATGLIGYQPEVPQNLLEEDKNVQL